MRKDILITANSKTSMVHLPQSRLGINGENLQGNLILKFEDEFVDGVAIIEIKRGNEKYYLSMTKDEDKYMLPILSSLLNIEGVIEFQIRITESGTNIPVWKSNIFFLKVEDAINATTEIPEEYPEWIDIANAKILEIDEAINEVDNLNIDAIKVDTTATIEITKKDGTTKTVNILDGEKGENGADGLDAKINGVNTLTIEAGTNITLDQEGSTLTINSTGGGSGGTSDYTDLTNKPKINNVELTGNKTSSDLGLQPAGNYVIDSNYVHTDNNYSSNEKNKLASLNNYDDTEIKQDIIDLESNIPTKLSDLTNDGNFVTDNNYVHTDNNFTDNLKNKLDGIETDATRTIVDSSITNTSTNPVENKVIYNALNSKLDTSLKGSANGIAELDSNGKILESQLPSYVDDVLEGYYYNNNFYEDSAHTKLITGETGKIYIDLATNKTYRWGGSTYVLISETITLGETSSTAYRGDRGKIAYEHSLITSGNPHNVTKSDVGLGNVENKSSSTIRSEITSSNVTNALGYTPYDSSNPNGYTNNSGTITGIKMNGVTKGTSGIVDLGTIITSHQDITGKEDKSNKVTSISLNSTDTEYPSAKCVYDYIQSLDGDEVNY